MIRKVCIFTGTRSEYGLLKPLMGAIKDDPDLHLQILVSGAHLVSEFGMTIREIETDGFFVDQKVDILSDDDTAKGVASSLGLGVSEYADALLKLSPDILVLLGDRYEMFAMATAASVCQVPIAHIHGGELTQGSLDEAFRHSITKMSHLHFASTDIYKHRIIQMGEEPKRVFHVGAMGVENAMNLEAIMLCDLVADLGLEIDLRTILVTFHPAMFDGLTVENQFDTVLNSLDSMSDVKIVFTKANADEGGRKINLMMKDYVEKSPENTILCDSLGQRRYLSLLKYVGVMVGNSSSGILEAPSFNLPVVNIGDRQKGRVRATNVIDCLLDSDRIILAIEKALSSGFRDSLCDMVSPYAKPGTAKEIKIILKSFDLHGILKKKFHDVDFIG